MTESLAIVRERHRPYIASPHVPLEVLGGNAVARRINGRRPVFIASVADEPAICVLKELRLLMTGDEVATRVYHTSANLKSLLDSQGLDPSACVPILSSTWLRGGRFTIAGSRRGKAITRFPASRGWLNNAVLPELRWHQVIFISREFSKSHGPKGVAEQIASWIH